MPPSQSTYEFSSAGRASDLRGESGAERSGFAHVSVGGELDVATAPKLGEALAAVPNGTAVAILDLRELTFMDSSGLRLILNATARLAEAGCRLVLIRGNDEIQRIFEITGTEQHLEFVAAPHARHPAIVPSRTRAFLRARFSLWLSASFGTVGSDGQAAVAPTDRRTAKHRPLDRQRSHPDESRSPPESRAPGSRRPHAGLPR